MAGATKKKAASSTVGRLISGNTSYDDLDLGDYAPVGEAGKPLEIDVALIDADPTQPRQEQADFDAHSLSGLANSVTRHGLLQPITLYRNGSRYVLVTGERRLRTVRDVLGQETIKALILDTPPANKRQIQIIENRQRRNLSDYDFGVALLQELEDKQTERDAARKLKPNLSRYTQSDLAEELGETESEVSRRLVVARFAQNSSDHPQVISFQRGELAFEPMLEVARAANRATGENRGNWERPSNQPDAASLSTRVYTGDTATAHSYQDEDSNDQDDVAVTAPSPTHKAREAVSSGRAGSVGQAHSEASAAFSKKAKTASDQIYFRGNWCSYADLAALIADLTAAVPAEPLPQTNPDEAENFAAKVALLATKVAHGYGG